MNITVMFLFVDDVIPQCVDMDANTFDEMTRGRTAYLTDVEGKWYLEYKDQGDIVRVLDVNGESLSRDCDKLSVQILEHFQITTPVKREVDTTGMRVVLKRMENFRRSVIYADKEELKSAVQYNTHNNSIGLFDFDTDNYYTIEETSEPIDTQTLPRIYLSVHYNPNRRKRD